MAQSTGAAQLIPLKERQVVVWKVVEDCDKKRAKYQEMYAADMVTLDELSTKLQELNQTRITAEGHLANARMGQNRIEELRATKRAILKSYATGIEYDGIHYFSPEMRREIYEALRLKVTVSKDGAPRMQGIADAQIIRLTRRVEEYGHEVEQYRAHLRVGGKLSSSKETATDVGRSRRDSEALESSATAAESKERPQARSLAAFKAKHLRRLNRPLLLLPLKPLRRQLVAAVVGLVPNSHHGF